MSFGQMTFREEEIRIFGSPNVSIEVNRINVRLNDRSFVDKVSADVRRLETFSRRRSDYHRVETQNFVNEQVEIGTVAMIIVVVVVGPVEIVGSYRSVEFLLNVWMLSENETGVRKNS